MGLAGAEEIRFLIEQYYDIQKLRVEAYNRLVAYAKEHQTELCRHFLSHLSDGSHSTSASHKHPESQTNNASQKVPESQIWIASQVGSESRTVHASHYSPEPHIIDASSQDKELCRPSRLAEAILKGIIPQPKELINLIWYYNQLRSTEKELGRRLDVWSLHHPLRAEWLSKVRGIGPILASGLIAWLHPISRFEYVSKLWSYSCLAPGQKRRRGQKLNCNLRIKTLAWKIATSFVKTRGFGRKLYDESRKIVMAKHPDWSKGHQHNWALRRTAKLFLACLWAKWRELEGLPVTKPYPIEFLGHKDIITPEMWVDEKKAKKVVGR